MSVCRNPEHVIRCPPLYCDGGSRWTISLSSNQTDCSCSWYNLPVSATQCWGYRHAQQCLPFYLSYGIPTQVLTYPNKDFYLLVPLSNPRTLLHLDCSFYLCVCMCLLSYTTHDQPPRGWTTHQELDPPTSIINKKSVPQTCQLAHGEACGHECRCLWGMEDGVESCGAGVTGCLMCVTELNSGPLQEHCVPLTTEPSLQPVVSFWLLRTVKGMGILDLWNLIAIFKLM